MAKSGIPPIEVVALVTSAGGLEALSTILRSLPATFRAAVVIAQHLGGHGSQLVPILARRTERTVRWAVDGSTITGGEVVVCPSQTVLEILPDRTCALRKTEGFGDRPLDALLTSIAHSFGARGLGVVLTGMGSDGAAGVAAIKASGGGVFVQSEESAEAPSMPRAAIAAGADIVLPLHDIAGVLSEVVAGAPMPRPGSEVHAIRATFGDSGSVALAALEIDWASTPFGPVHEWPASLRAIVRHMMDAPDPITIVWGVEGFTLANDAALLLLGRSPQEVLSQRHSDLFPEAQAQMGPLRQRALGGNSVRIEHAPLPVVRGGRLEDAWWDYDFRPIRDIDGRVLGVFSAFRERTLEVLASRRLTTVNLLAALPPARGRRHALQQAVDVLSHADDITFALAYLADGQRANLVSAGGAEEGSAIAPHDIRLARGEAWPVIEVIQGGEPVILDDLHLRFRGFTTRTGELAVGRAGVYPLRDEAEDTVVGVLVLGVHPRLPFDDAYRAFLTLVCESVNAALAEAHARVRERERVTRLNELDRAKTEFFSNVSHEFRTPLTLMLAPLDELQRRRDEFSPEVADDLMVASKNARRLLTLVNTLLDFSQIEAGRLQAQFAPTDLAKLTTELAAVFRSAVDRAGLRFVVNCSTLREPVWVDATMWEKIVSNLLSNALKFTLEGEVTVQLNERPGHAELVVSDTGSGIPEDQLPHIFKRFHRVRTPNARTDEGSGIGLALVYELVRLHTGRIRVRSVEGSGTTFTVWIPFGKRAMDEEERAASRQDSGPWATASVLAREAERWESPPRVPDGIDDGALGGASAEALAALAPGATILVVDDNVDMRDYMRRMLSARWHVFIASDGEQALAMARECIPDLIVTDVMMPNVDGFALLRAIRADDALRQTRVMLVTARAGEESAIEGLMAGADDYITKPFSARELVARVGGQLEMARSRRRSDDAGRAQDDSQERERQAYLVRLREALASVADPVVMETTAAGLLASQLNATRVQIGARPGEGKAAASIEVCDDTAGNSGTSAGERDALAAAGIGAYVAVPLVYDGAWAATLAVHDVSPRHWRAHEIELVQETAEHIRAAVERARIEGALRTNERWMRAQKEALQATIDGASFEDALRVLACLVSESTGGDARMALFLASPGGRTLHAVRGVGGMPDTFLAEWEDVLTVDDAGAAGPRLTSDRVTLTTDVLEEPSWEPWTHLARGYNFRGCLSFPITAPDNRLLGVFAMYFTAPHEATPGDLALADVVTRTAATIITHDETARQRERVAAERDRVEGLLRENKERQAFLLELSDEFTRHPDEASVGRACVAALARHMGVARCFIWESGDKKGEGVVGPEYHGAGLAPVAGVHSHRNYPIALARLRRGPFMVPDVASDPDLSELEKASISRGLNLGALISAPLSGVDGNAIWTLSVGTTGPRAWSSDDLRFVQDVAERTYAAIVRARAGSPFTTVGRSEG